MKRSGLFLMIVVGLALAGCDRPIVFGGAASEPEQKTPPVPVPVYVPAPSVTAVESTPPAQLRFVKLDLSSCLSGGKLGRNARKVCDQAIRLQLAAQTCGGAESRDKTDCVKAALGSGKINWLATAGKILLGTGRIALGFRQSDNAAAKTIASLEALRDVGLIKSGSADTFNLSFGDGDNQVDGIGKGNRRDGDGDMAGRDLVGGDLTGGDRTNDEDNDIITEDNDVFGGFGDEEDPEI